MYTATTILQGNELHAQNYGISEKKLLQVNYAQFLIESHLYSSVPKAGDIIRSPKYKNMHIESIDENGRVSVCEEPYTPFVILAEHARFNTSGGAWFGVNAKNLKYVGTEEKHFNFMATWSAGGAINFKATVKVWEIDYKKEIEDIEKDILESIEGNTKRNRTWDISHIQSLYN